MIRRRTLSTATRLAGTALALSGLALTGLPVAPALAASTDRVDLRVLVVTNGDSNVEAIRTQLASEGVPTTVVDLNQSGRPVITDAFLSDTVSTGPRAKFQSVVLPNEYGGTLASSELTALSTFEARFGIRQVDAYVYPNPTVGLNYPDFNDSTAYGPMDGATATVTSAGLASPFPYLKGSFSVDDFDPSVDETYGYLSTPTTTAFTPLVTLRGGRPTVGSYNDGSREQLVLTTAFNANQQWFRVMAHGLITWMTKGVHLGYQRNYFAVQVDDVFLPDSRWSTDGNCTPGDDCAAGVPATTDIRMTPADVSYLVNWQKANGYTLDLAFNAAGSVDEIAANGSDPLTTSLLANKGSLRWLNHTYSHQFLGCIQDFTVLPWRCQTDANGNTLYLSQQEISDEISKNVAWATQNKVSIQAGDLVTGEHSGLRTLPQQPDDNPNLAGALTANKITSIASDASRETAQRQVGSALTVRRHPMNVFYNVATAAEEVDEYNWLYNSAADGGSGLCERAGSTCIAPLSPSTGYSSYIVPIETRIALSHVLGNDPMPHYMHQSNLTEGRIGYAVIGSVLDAYKQLFATNAPVQNLRLGQQQSVMQLADAWTADQAGVSAYTLGNKLIVSTTSKSKIQAPVTVPSNVSFGSVYGGERSAYFGTNAKTSLSLSL